ncbi:MAG: hypothetical protein WC775_04765 [Patescibacteria group bacterium]|jgi:hypothetical protein
MLIKRNLFIFVFVVVVALCGFVVFKLVSQSKNIPRYSFVRVPIQIISSLPQKKITLSNNEWLQQTLNKIGVLKQGVLKENLADNSSPSAITLKKIRLEFVPTSQLGDSYYVQLTSQRQEVVSLKSTITKDGVLTVWIGLGDFFYTLEYSKQVRTIENLFWQAIFRAKHDWQLQESSPIYVNFIVSTMQKKAFYEQSVFSVTNK